MIEMMRKPKFKVYKNEETAFYFTLRSANGEPILSSQGYRSLQGAEKGIQSVVENSRDDRRYLRKLSDDLKYFFVLKARNGQVIGTSELYSSKSGREKGIKAVRRAARLARVEYYDLSA